MRVPTFGDVLLLIECARGLSTPVISPVSITTILLDEHPSPLDVIDVE